METRANKRPHVNSEYGATENLQNSSSSAKKNRPCAKFRLKNAGEIASLSTSVNERIPLMLTDVQHLLLHSLLGSNNLSHPPRWYAIEKSNQVNQTTCLIFEGISVQHWDNNYDSFPSTKKIFHNYVEILTPAAYNESLVRDLALVLLSEAEKDELIHKYGSMELAFDARTDIIMMLKAVFPIKDKVEKINYNSEDNFPRTQLVLSAWQLIEQNYPVPLKGKLKNNYSDYVMTKDEYEPVSSSSPMFGLDCEMCMTAAGLELTRISIVNEEHEIIYESLVKPYNNITDYLTQYSGITKAMLTDVTKRLEDVQNDLKKLLPSDAILIGQSLNLDLHALKMMHPYVIDTSCIYNFTGERMRKPKLKALAKEFLHEDIQSSKQGHCSVEDSLASMKLVQLKLSKSLEYGDAVHSKSKRHKENTFTEYIHEYSLSLFNHMIKHKKTSLIVGCDDITGDYHTYLTKAKENLASQLKKNNLKKVKLTTVDSKDEVIETLSKAIAENNFAMGHLKLEINNDNQFEYMKMIDKWIEDVWSKAAQSSLFVVLFGGTLDENGLAMIRMKGYT